jgi:hypothetical protein
MIRDFYNRLSNPLRAAIATAVFTFSATAFTALIGLLGEIQQWVDGGGEPNWDTLAKVVVSAAVAAFSGLLNFGVRWFQQRSNPTAGPHYGEV